MIGKQFRDPVTRDQWQQAVDAAEGMLTLDAAVRYGLVISSPMVNVDRCLEILNRGRKLGIIPERDAVQRFVAGCLAGGAQ